jgi:hypothetical protein
MRFPFRWCAVVSADENLHCFWTPGLSNKQLSGQLFAEQCVSNVFAVQLFLTVTAVSAQHSI